MFTATEKQQKAFVLQLSLINTQEMCQVSKSTRTSLREEQTIILKNKQFLLQCSKNTKCYTTNSE